MRVARDGAQFAPILDGIEHHVLPRRDPAANGGARATVVDAPLSQRVEQVEHALRWELRETRRDELALFFAIAGERRAPAGEEIQDDQRLIEMIDSGGQGARVEATIVARDIGMKKFDGQRLSG